MSQQRIAFFLPNLYGGGAERVSVNLLKGMVDNKNLVLDLVLGIAEGSFLEQVPEGVNIINLQSPRVATAILPLVKYLKNTQPDALLSHLGHANVIALLANKLAGSKTRLAVVEHNTLSVADATSLRAKVTPWFMERFYPSADAIIGVSEGVSADLENQLNFAPGSVKTIYNPVINEELLAKANTPVSHPWLKFGELPVFLAVGRLTAQKDFVNLIRAFALVRQQKAARLIILGEGELRSELEELANTLGVKDDIDLPGFADNPYGYMNRVTAFVLSSRYEGLPTALIEAMACGCSVVSTNCPSGPEEILAGGKYGYLVPIQDSKSLSEAMLNVLDKPTSRDTLQQRAKIFSTEQIVPQYLETLLDYKK
ncbi:glycosyltransferase [Waterburya agarophytonicola K14]|uniref:Glycosyltransferase n=1 Tax=Waterburya agarophytonicola KI4 TaxID=2874699 RepID=A0A964BT84_9CYAN|nr:glycosyltransferase [Waterburya agarophytonicola]MCC0177425.1 glycosyltransferase [Waterburya agarophytonicola KI4]